MMSLSFFSNTYFSPTANVAIERESLPYLHQVFKHERFDELDELLKNISLAQLMIQDKDGRRAWEYLHIPEEQLRKVIDKWVSLIANSEEQARLELPDLLVPHIANGLAVGRILDLDDLKAQLNRTFLFKVSVVAKEVSTEINYYFSIISAMLTGINIAPSLLLTAIDSCINNILPVVIFLLGIIRINEIFTQSSQLDIKEYLELGFILASFALTIASIVLVSQSLLIIGAVAGMMQSEFELARELIAYQESPIGTERRMSHKQQSFFLMGQLGINLISLGLVGLFLSQCAGMAPLIVCLAIIMTANLTWSLLPLKTKRDIKTEMGLGKASYFEEVENLSKQDSADVQDALTATAAEDEVMSALDDQLVPATVSF